MGQPTPALTYTSYLALDDLLAAQRPRSDEHDELLFIVIHQVYELWFKQLLHETGRLARCLEQGDTHHALATLKRMLTIWKTLVAQVDVLETMTPMSFSSFRRIKASAIAITASLLASSSFFASWYCSSRIRSILGFSSGPGAPPNAP